MSEVDLLLGVRDDLRQGALRFRLAEQGPFLAIDTDTRVSVDTLMRVDAYFRLEAAMHSKS
jgi:hypothetical protein